MNRIALAVVLLLFPLRYGFAQVPSDREALQKGEGSPEMKSIESYGYPDPLRVLQFATTLNINTDQKRALQSIIDEMKIRSKELGQQIIRVESELDEAFRSGMVSERSARDDAEQIGRMRGRLRGVYLAAFLGARRVLTFSQIDMYKKLIAPPEKKTKK